MKVAVLATVLMVTGWPDGTGAQPETKCNEALRWSAIARARLQDGKRTGNFGLVLEGLAAADKALMLEPMLQEAQFTRNVAVGLLQPKFELPQDYRARLRAAAQSEKTNAVIHIAACSPTDAREFAEDISLGEWAYGIRSGRLEYAAEELNIARQIGRALAELFNDHLAADAVAAIDNAVKANDREHINALALGHESFAVSRSRLPQALAAFRRGRSPMGDAAAAKASRYGPFDGTTLLLHASTKYPTVRATQHWVEGRRFARDGELHEAREAFAKARAIFKGVAEDDAIAKIRAEEIFLAMEMGDYAEAWRLRMLALSEAAAAHDQFSMRLQLSGAVRHAVAMRAWSLARSMATLLLDPSYPDFMDIELLLDRAVAEWNEGDRHLALADVQRARVLANKNPERRQYASSLIDAAEAAMLRNEDPTRATELLAKTTGVVMSAARPDRRLTIAEAAWTLSRFYGGAPDDIYTDVVDLLLKRGDARGAFAMSEVGRTRDLRDHANIETVRHSLGPKTLVVSFIALEDRLGVFALDANGFRTIEVPIRRKDLRARIDARAPLYDTLFGSLSLGRYDTLVIAPDDALASVSFAALVNPATHRYLIQDSVITIVPSASTYVRLVAMPAAPRATALVVGDPAFDRRLYPSLNRLPRAAQEARFVAKLYHSELLAWVKPVWFVSTTV